MENDGLPSIAKPELIKKVLATEQQLTDKKDDIHVDSSCNGSLTVKLETCVGESTSENDTFINNNENKLIEDLAAEDDESSSNESVADDVDEQNVLLTDDDARCVQESERAECDQLQPPDTSAVKLDIRNESPLKHIDNRNEENIATDEMVKTNESAIEIDDVVYSTGDTRRETISQVKKAEIVSLASEATEITISAENLSVGSSESNKLTDIVNSDPKVAHSLQNGHAKNSDDASKLSPKVSPRLVRKKAVRLSHGKRHSANITNEDILSAYDIIDRSDLKTIVSSVPRRFMSFSSIAMRLKRAFSNDVIEVEERKQAKRKPPAAHQKVAVTLSLERTQDGEQIQIITLGKDKDLSASQSDGTTIYVNGAPPTDDEMSTPRYEDVSDAESDRSSIYYDDDNDVIDGDFIGFEHGDTDEKSELADELGEMRTKKPSSAVSRASKTFSSADRARPSQVDTNRRITVGGTDIKVPDYFTLNILPGSVSDGKRLKKKTLSDEKILLFTDGFPASFPSFPSDRRSLIALEIYTTERTFVRGLEIIVLLFKRQIVDNNIMDGKEVNIVFSNIESILDLNRQILDQLVDRISDWSDEQKIGDVFMNFENNFKIYSEFCTNYDNGEAYLKQKQKKKKDLDSLLNSCYRNPVCFPGLTLPSYLITVIQRIPRYILLFKDLLKRTSVDHPDYQNIFKVVKMMEKVASYLNEQLKQAQCAKALEALQTQITGLKAYFTPDRNLVHEGYVSLLSSKKTYQCVLFNDLLVFAIKGANKQSSVELALDLKTIWVEDLEDMDPQTTKNDAIAIYTPDRPYTMYVGKSGEKSIWMNHLKMAIARILYDINASNDSNLDTRETSYTYPDGSVYSGFFYLAKRHGEGTMMWPNQMTYRGEWCDDERNGFGVLEYLNGDTYEGQWMDDNQHGLGTFKYKSGDIISGEWKNGFRNGQIAINFKNGDKFLGQCINDKIEGVGELTCVNGFHYAGQWLRNLKHGKGKLTSPDGGEYSGYFLRGKYHGRGELNYPDGSIYKGEFERGERSGIGTFTIPGLSVYEGQWMHDMKDGHGKMTYENGDEYVGTWVQDMRIGKGVMFYNYGGCYRGQWQSDCKHGVGLMEFRDGRSYDGEWSNGAMNGTGIMKYKHGDLYNGSWKDNQPSGKGIFTKPGGWSCDGIWLQGKQHGRCILKDPINKYHFDGEFVNGLKEGHGTEKIDQITFEGEFVDDLRDGHGKETHTDGSTYIGHWSQGQKHGHGTKKHNNGMVERQVWNYGSLTKSPLLLSPRDLPNLQRFL